MENIGSLPSSSLPEEFLAQLISEVDDETVTAIILHGSYARGDALPPYSDVDLVRILYETPERKQLKRFIWRNGYLLNLSSRPLSIYQEWLALPIAALLLYQETVRLLYPSLLSEHKETIEILLKMVDQMLNEKII